MAADRLPDPAPICPGCKRPVSECRADDVDESFPVSAAVPPAEPRKGSTAEMIHMEGGERVYPCRCGETHRGEYGATDFGHHDCFHDAPIWAVPDDPGHFICGSCGKSFMTEERFNAR